MEITIVADVLGMPNNGTSIATYNLINTLREHGHHVRILCPDALRTGQEDFFVARTMNFGYFNEYVAKNGVTLAKRDWDLVDQACRGADLVHSMCPFSLGWAAAKYCHINHIPFTSGFHVQAENVMAHFFLLKWKTPNTILYHWLWKHYYSYCDAIHFPTEFISNVAKKMRMVGPTRYIISNGVDTSQFYVDPEFTKPKFLQDKFVIVMSGRLTKEKNQKTLIRAVMKSKYKDSIQIMLCGEGPLKDDLAHLGRNLPNPPIIQFYPHEYVSTILRSADLYVHCSIAEIEAISCLEAVACGAVPVISDSPRSATSMFALRPECLFKMKNPTDLAKRIDWWISHPEERKKTSREASEWVKQFDFKGCMEKMNDMVVEVVKNYKPENNTWLEMSEKKILRKMSKD